MSIAWQFDSVISDVSTCCSEDAFVCCAPAVVCGDVGLTGMDCSPDLPV